MTRITTRSHVAYTPKQMYDLVNDAATYPRYLPLCGRVQVHAKSADRQTATITLAKGKIKFDFTIATVMEDGKRIDIALVDGPFKHLRGTWLFAPARQGGSDISFELDFEFSNPLLGLTFGGLGKSMAKAMVGAFSEQAALRYGKPTGDAKPGGQPDLPASRQSQSRPRDTAT